MAKSKTSKKTAQRQVNVIPAWVWGLVVVIIALGGYWLIQVTNQRQATVSSLPREISVAEAAQLDRDEWLFLDVREQSEWNEGHIDGAILIPLGQLKQRAGELPTDKNILVVCRSGNRSAEGRDILLIEGFDAVTSMAGGINDWVALGNLVVPGP
ncbi:MAG: rhodanese-like domain-containing protein [Chloroflexi bacterium]|nr:rhodanese-like domain-containing protein [Chloroflexota bacterium]